MPLTAAQLSSLQPVIQAAAALSIVGSLSIIVTYTSYAKFRLPSNKLVFVISIADLFASIFMFLAAWPVSTFKVQTICTIQGWGISFFLLAAMFWTACLSWQCLIAIRKGTKLESFDGMYRWFHVVSWGFPFLFATLPIFLGNEQDGPVYTDATLWCWIGSRYQELRFYLFYMWLWIIFSWNLFVYAFVGFILWKTQKKLSAQGKGSEDGEQWKPSRSMRIYVRKTSFFILAFFVNWFPGSLNRIQNMADPANPVYALFLLHAIFTPLQGFLNFIAYFLVHFLFQGTNQQSTAAETSNASGSMDQAAYVNYQNAVQITGQDATQYAPGRGPDYASSDGKSYGSNEPIFSNGYSVYSPSRTQTVNSNNNMPGPVYNSPFQQQPMQTQASYQQPMTQYQPANAALSPMFSASLQPTVPEPAQPNYSGAAQLNFGSPQYGR